MVVGPSPVYVLPSLRQNATEMPKWPIIICPHHRTTLGRDNQQP
eukprot:SAG31_NODE_48405_length_190_cov_99.648352_1_plen_43_part_10